MCGYFHKRNLRPVNSPAFRGKLFSSKSVRKFDRLRIKPFDLAKLSISLDFSKVTAVLPLKKFVTVVLRILLVTVALLAEVINGKVTVLLLEQKNSAVQNDFQKWSVAATTRYFPNKWRKFSPAMRRIYLLTS